MSREEILACGKHDLTGIGEVACPALPMYEKLTAQVSLKLFDGPAHAGRRNT
ncbi:MAG: hypothetical protein WAU69_06690 [Solirubrobacteraceae bacterium]